MSEKQTSSEERHSRWTKWWRDYCINRKDMTLTGIGMDAFEYQEAHYQLLLAAKDAEIAELKNKQTEIMSYARTMAVTGDRTLTTDAAKLESELAALKKENEEMRIALSEIFNSPHTDLSTKNLCKLFLSQ